MALRSSALDLGDLRIGSDTDLPVIAEPGHPLLSRLSVLGLRAYGTLDAEFGPGPQLIVGPNAAGKPTLLEAIAQLAVQRTGTYVHDLATYTRTLQQRNSLLRAIREEQATRDELRFWDASFLDAGGAIVAERLRLLDDLAEPLARAHAEIAPEEAGAARLGVGYATNAPALPGETPRDALARRLVETAEKEV